MKLNYLLRKNKLKPAAKVSGFVRWQMVCFLIFMGISCAAQASTGIYINGQWDKACEKCWPAPRIASNNHCLPKDCAIQGYYHCQPQNPPLAPDDDTRLISLVHAGKCTYLPRNQMSAQEANYVNENKLCVHVLDKMAGRFILPEETQSGSILRGDFYLTRAKATLTGNVQDIVKLASYYDRGLGTHQNREKATDLYTAAAEKGMPFAEYALAVRYAYGVGIKQNTDKALFWLKKSIDHASLLDRDKSLQPAIKFCAINLIGRLAPA